MSLNKSALQLLNAYSSEEDNSEDDMSSCGVQTKKPNYEVHNRGIKKRKIEKLPSPKFVKSTVKVDDHLDNPLLHHGRVRSFGHVRGNWSTFIYLPYCEIASSMNQLITLITEMCAPSIQLEQVDDFHISLTKTVILKHHWIDLFINSVKEKLSSSCLKRFLILFNNLQVYTNEERTRTFIGFDIKSGFDSLMEAVHICDKSLKEFNLETFYKDPSFHMSILWCLGDQKSSLEDILPTVKSKVAEFILSNDEEPWYIDAKQFICKCGNKYYNFYLK